MNSIWNTNNKIQWFIANIMIYLVTFMNEWLYKSFIKSRNKEVKHEILKNDNNEFVHAHFMLHQENLIFHWNWLLHQAQRSMLSSSTISNRLMEVLISFSVSWSP